jgi:hypothetical protein
MRAPAGVRDIAADWKRWSWAERIIAVAIASLFVLTVSVTLALMGR